MAAPIPAQVYGVMFVRTLYIKKHRHGFIAELLRAVELGTDTLTGSVEDYVQHRRVEATE